MVWLPLYGRHCTKSVGGLYIDSTCFYVGSTRKFRAKFRNREPDALDGSHSLE